MADLDLSGRTLGDFVLRERIDQGGYGAVYRCEQSVLGRQAVVKVLHQRLRHDDVALQRFLREAQLASRLEHPYAAHIYSFGVEGEDGLPWIAMELVHGCALNHWLRTRGPMPLEQFVPFFDRVAQVVQVAHDRGIVHRDLKPSNIMVSEGADFLFPKLLDFGIAKVVRDVAPASTRTWPDGSVGENQPADAADLHGAITERIMPTRRPRGAGPRARRDSRRGPASTGNSSTRSNRITRSNAGVGSPAYMSPEQWSDAVTVGPAADLYALGVVAYEALTGRLPFPADSTDGYCEQHCNAVMPPMGNGFSPALEQILKRALAKRAEDRYGSVLELAAALRAELRTQPREQVRVAAQQWIDQGRPHSLLWRGDLLRAVQLPTAIALTEPEVSFLEASRRFARRATRNRHAIVVLGVVAAFGGLEYRSAVQTRIAELKTATAEQRTLASEELVTQAHLEQGRWALVHGDFAEAQQQILLAYQRGDHSLSTQFMLARALASLHAEQARFAATSGRMWSAIWSPDGKRIVTTDDNAAQIWDAQTHQRLVSLPHGDTVYDAKFTSGGTRVVTASGDGRVRIWDTSSGALVRELTRPGQRPRYYALAVSPNSQFVAAIDIDGHAADVWDAETGAPRASLQSDALNWPMIEFSPDGRWLAVGSGNEVRVFNAVTWARVATLTGPHIRALSFDPSSTQIATVSLDGNASLWAISTGARLRSLREGVPLESVAWSPDGERIAVGGRDGEVQIWDTAGKLRSQINHIHDRVVAVEFDPTSKLIVAAGSNGSVVISDVELGLAVSELQVPRNVVRTVHFDATSRRLLSASWDGTARIWDATPAYRQWTSSPVADNCYFGSGVVPDSRFVIIGCPDQKTRVWDTARDRLLVELPSIARVANDFAPAFPAISVAGDRAAIIRGDTVELYAVPGGQLLQTIDHHAEVSAVAFAATGDTVISGDVHGRVLVTPDGGEPRALPVAPSSVDAVALLADGRAVIADASKKLRVIDAEHGSSLADLAMPTRAMVLRFSPDAHALLTVPSYAVPAPATLWNLTRYEKVIDLKGHVGQTRSAQFVHGGREILTTGNDGTARQWDGATGHLLQTYQGGTRLLSHAALSPDGTLLVAGGGDGILRFWDAASARPLWTLQVHRSFVAGLHFEGEDIVTRGIGGDISRWVLPRSREVIETSDGREPSANVSP